MKNAGQNFLYLCKSSSMKFDLESNWNILNEKCRPEFPISLQNLLNEIRFRIKLQLSGWKTQARSYISLQNFLNEIRFRIKLKHSEWKTKEKFPTSLKISSRKFELESNCNFLNEKGRSEIPSNFPQRNSIWNQIETFWRKNAGQSFLYLCKISSTKFDLESNWNILNEKRGPEFPTSLQNFLNEIRFRIRLQLSERK